MRALDRGRRRNPEAGRSADRMWALHLMNSTIARATPRDRVAPPHPSDIAKWRSDSHTNPAICKSVNRPPSAGSPQSYRLRRGDLFSASTAGNAGGGSGRGTTACPSATQPAADRTMIQERRRLDAAISIAFRVPGIGDISAAIVLSGTPPTVTAQHDYGGPHGGRTCQHDAPTGQPKTAGGARSPAVKRPRS